MHALPTKLLIEIGLLVGLEREYSAVEDMQDAGRSNTAIGARTAGVEIA